jgi:hypothetical protein
VRWVGLRNTWTGQVIVLDTFKIRLGRMKTRIFVWAQKVDLWRKSNPSRMVLVTLTYRKASNYKAGDIGTYLKNIKTRLGKSLYAFAWVAELQARGAVHYHVILVVKVGTDIPMPDKRGYWTHGKSKIETARTAFYLATYTGKEYQKDLSRYPKGCRLYATSIRSSMGIKTAVRASGGQKQPKIRTSEGGPVWEFGKTAVGENGREYVELLMGGENQIGEVSLAGAD